MDAHGPLERVLAIEATGSDDAGDYASALRTLAAALRADDAVETAHRMTLWLIPALGLDLGGPPKGDRWREALWDAAVDALADAEALAAYLDKVADRLDVPGTRSDTVASSGLADADVDPPRRAPVGARRPAHLNLLAMIRTRVGWRAKDKLRRRDRYQKRFGGEYLPDRGGRDDRGARVAALCVDRVRDAFADDPDAAPIIEGLLMGGTISEVSRSANVSRQRIYRLLARMRAWIEGAS